MFGIKKSLNYQIIKNYSKLSKENNLTNITLILNKKK